MNPVGLLTEEEVAKVAGIAAYDLRMYFPPGFGVPGHWFPNRQGTSIYTDKGISELAAGLEAAGQTVAAVCLRAKLTELRETPSRAMIPATAKDHPAAKTWYHEGQYR